MTIRPIRREYAAIEQEFVRGHSNESRLCRLMDGTRELNARMLRFARRLGFRPAPEAPAAGVGRIETQL